MNSNVTLVGNLTRDPDRRELPSGRVLVSFSIAVNRRWPNDAGGWAEQVSFFPVVAWQQLGENAFATLSKGDRVVVVGRPEQRSWTNTAGDRRSVIEFVADEVAPSLRFTQASILRSPRELSQNPAPQTRTRRRAVLAPPQVHASTSAGLAQAALAWVLARIFHERA